MTPPWPTEQPVLSDERAVLRGWEPGDAEPVFRACQDPAIQHFTRVPVPYRREHADYFVRQGPQKWRSQEGAGFAVVDRATDALLGSCGLVDVDLETGFGAVGYWVAPWARHRGVARAALLLLTEWSLGSGGLSRLVLEAEEHNVASAAVAAAAGFERIGEPVVEELKGTERRLLTYERLRGD